MDWKEFFKPTKWKIILSFSPLILLSLSLLSMYFISKFFSEGSYFSDVPFGLYMFSLIFFWPPLTSIFCKYTFLADGCYGFLAFPTITLLGYLLAGLINGTVIYLIYSLIAKIAIKHK